MHIHLRPATAHDYGVVIQLFAEGDAIHYQALPDHFPPHAAQRDQAWLATWLARDDAALVVAAVDQQIVGLVQFHVLPGALSATIVVDSVVVHTSYRQQGIGRALMHHVHMWAQARHITRVELQVFEFNAAARHLYEHLGYQTLARRMYWQDQG